MPKINLTDKQKAIANVTVWVAVHAAVPVAVAVAAHLIEKKILNKETPAE